MYVAEAVPSNSNVSKPEVNEYIATEKHMVLYMSGSSTDRSSSQLQHCQACKVYSDAAIDRLGIDVNTSFSTSETLYL